MAEKELVKQDQQNKIITHGKKLKSCVRIVPLRSSAASSLPI